jgi:hypothetical protein
MTTGCCAVLLAVVLLLVLLPVVLLLVVAPLWELLHAVRTRPETTAATANERRTALLTGWG